MELKELKEIAKLIRYDILTTTTAAGSGHPTSSLSAVELATVLFFGGFLRQDIKNFHNPSNDHFILSKGHASPLLYSLYHAVGALEYDKLLTLRQFTSDLEGHPTPRLPFVDVATGSLGQGLSVGLGMALGLRLKFGEKKAPRVFVLLGDSEMAEGQIWEAIEIASFYKLDNLIGIIDVNRLGQRGETMYGHHVGDYQKRVAAFGWHTVVVDDGHDLVQVQKAFEEAVKTTGKPVMIIAKTLKGKGVSLLEDKDGWHGKTVSKDKLDEALKELGEIDKTIRGVIAPPSDRTNTSYQTDKSDRSAALPPYKIGDLVATREAYGDAIAALGKSQKNIVVLDGEVSNSTMAEKFKETDAKRFFEMFIAEQNMVSAALGMSKVGFVPFASSFAAFLTRAHDQIRMAQYSKPNLKIVGSHAGVSIGEDGPSQMGLEDIGMMRGVEGSVVFYPSDATSCAALTKILADNVGIYYLRTTRAKTPVIYENQASFKVGGSNVLKSSTNDQAVVFAAGITLHEALKAHEELKKENINIRVVDLYSVKPLDVATIQQCSNETMNAIVVEDHYPEGGIGEAVLSVISTQFSDIRFTHLAVRKLPRSGKPEELLSFEEIDSAAIIKAVKQAV